MTPASVRDESRKEAATRGLTPTAVAHLTRDALGAIDLAALAPVKQLLKRFFSDAAWTAADDTALAALVGPGSGWWRYELDEELELEFGWRAGAFRMEVAPRAAADDAFDGPVTPEATPNPRTIRFVTPNLHEGPSRWYESASGVDDSRVARLFTDFGDVANVLVGPGFVAVGLHRPDQWERVLDPMLRVVTTEFAAGAERESADAPRDVRAAAHPDAATEGRTTALEHAWHELGSLRADDPQDLDRIVAAASARDVATRQVAARLLVEGDAAVAERVWRRLLDDPSRGVRRATVDAMVDDARPALRPLLERALVDADSWTRWKALRGIVDLGAEASRAAVEPLAEDPDFRVRLEATRALRAAGTS